MQKIFLKSLLFVGLLGVTSCAPWLQGESEKEYAYEDEAIAEVAVDTYVEPQPVFTETPLEAAKIYNKRVPPLNTVIVCRDRQCAPAELSMSREYIFNSLAHLMDNNLDETALLCEANPQAHVCVNPYLTVPAKVGVTPAYVYFDGVKLVDGSSVKGKTALNLTLGYNLSYNGQTPTVCKPDRALLYVKGNNDIVLNGSGFKCEMTSVGATTIRIMFNIDYIDVDYGYIGGYYSIGLSGPANGGGSGYGLIRLVKDVKPLNPVLNKPATKDGAAQGQSNGSTAVNQPTKPMDQWVNNANGVQVKAVPASGERVAVQQVSPNAGQMTNQMMPADVPTRENISATAIENIPNAEPQIVYEGGQETPRNNAAARENPAPNPEYDEVYENDLDDYIK